MKDVFIDSDAIQWGAQSIVKLSDDSKLLEPPKWFVLRGIKYEFCQCVRQLTGGVTDGETWFLAFRFGQLRPGCMVWVSEAREGEFSYNEKDESFVPKISKG